MNCVDAWNGFDEQTFNRMDSSQLQKLDELFTMCLLGRWRRQNFFETELVWLYDNIRLTTVLGLRRRFPDNRRIDWRWTCISKASERLTEISFRTVFRYSLCRGAQTYFLGLDADKEFNATDIRNFWTVFNCWATRRGGRTRPSFFADAFLHVWHDTQVSDQPESVQARVQFSSALCAETFCVLLRSDSLPFLSAADDQHRRFFADAFLHVWHDTQVSDQPEPVQARVQFSSSLCAETSCVLLRSDSLPFLSAAVDQHRRFFADAFLHDWHESHL